MIVGFYGGKFLPLHIGHVACIVEASGRCDILYVGLSHSQIRDKQLCQADGFEYIEPEKRLQWLDQIASELPNVKVIDFEDTDGIDYRSWVDGAKQVSSKIYNDCQSEIAIVFGSENEYKETFERIYPNAMYRLLDADRDRFKISATQIRKLGAFKCWDYIPRICKPYYNKKVVIVGTESCGKSTMVKKLAAYYNTNYVSEFGRTMCERLNTGQPTAEYYPYIAYGHKMQEFEKNEVANKFLFVDTESIVTQFYSQLYANIQYKILYDMAETHQYDLWIFLEPDVEWMDDGLRVHGSIQQRSQNNETLKLMLESNGINYHIVSGNYQERFLKCVRLVDKLR